MIDRRLADAIFLGINMFLPSPRRVASGCGERMSCMLTHRAGTHSFDELGIQKVLPDVSFIAQYRDKIEAVFITHGHEDHIGAMPWVIPALDPRTPVYTGGFTMELVKRRMLEYNLWDDKRFITVNRGDKCVPSLPHPKFLFATKNTQPPDPPTRCPT